MKIIDSIQGFIKVLKGYSTGVSSISDPICHQLELNKFDFINSIGLIKMSFLVQSKNIKLNDYREALKLFYKNARSDLCLRERGMHRIKLKKIKKKQAEIIILKEGYFVPNLNLSNHN